MAIDYIQNTRIGGKFLWEYWQKWDGVACQDDETTVTIVRSQKRVWPVFPPEGIPDNLCQILHSSPDTLCIFKFPNNLGWISLICLPRPALQPSPPPCLYLLCAPGGWLIWIISTVPSPSSWISSWGWPTETGNWRERERWVGVFIFQIPLMQDYFRLPRSLHQRWWGSANSSSVFRLPLAFRLGGGNIPTVLA